MLPCVCSVLDHRRRQNVVRTSVTHSAIASCATFLFLPHFDVICDLLLNRRTATWNLFVNQKSEISPEVASWIVNKRGKSGVSKQRRGVCDSPLLIVYGGHVIIPRRVENDLIGCYS